MRCAYDQNKRRAGVVAPYVYMIWNQTIIHMYHPHALYPKYCGSITAHRKTRRDRSTVPPGIYYLFFLNGIVVDDDAHIRQDLNILDFGAEGVDLDQQGTAGQARHILHGLIVIHIHAGQLLKPGQR